MATKKKITLKDKSENLLYPRTTAQVVEVNANENLTQFLAGILNGTKTVGKATNATNADNAGKLEGSTKEQILQAADTAAGVAAGNMLVSAKNYTDTKVASIKPIDPATTGAVGTVRLATQKEVDDGEVIDNIPAGSNPDEPAAVVVTPMALAKKLKKYATSTEMETAIADKIAEVVANADTDFDTLKEIADWILNDTTGAAAMANDIATLKGDVETAETDIANLKTKDTSHDNSITAINNALYGSGNARKFVTLEEFNPVKLNADDVPALVTWKKQVSEKTIIDDTLVSVFSAIADGEGNDIASTYAKTTDIKEVDKTTVEGLIGVAGITYVYDTSNGTDEVIY